MRYFLPFILFVIGLSNLQAQVPVHTRQLFYQLPLERSKEELDAILKHDSLRFKAMPGKEPAVFLCLKKDSTFNPVPDQILIGTREVKPKGDSAAYREIVIHILFEKGKYKAAQRFNKQLFRFARSDYKSFQGTQRKSRVTQDGKYIGEMWTQHLMFFEKPGMQGLSLEIIWTKAGNNYENIISVSYRLKETP